MHINTEEMITIPEGYYLMGTDCDNSDADYEEAPQRRVWLSAFKMQRTPVTVENWKHFLRETGYTWSLEEELQRTSKDLMNAYIEMLQKDGYDGSIESLVAKVSPGDDYPITWVSWIDAIEFVRWLNDCDGSGWSLPTEHQWEKACRGTDGRKFPWDTLDTDQLIEASNFHGTNRPIGIQPTRQTPYGCLDMWCNVSEWCEDWYNGDWYHEHVYDLNNPKGPRSGEYKVFRGGSALDSAWPRCSFRGFQYPTMRHPRIGFRLVQNSDL